MLYHERWGHQDKRHVKVMLEKELDIKVGSDKGLCESYIYGKAHRLPFGHRERASKAGELVSADVCGLFPESFQKNRYLIVFKDSYTKFDYAYIVKEKSEVKNFLKHVIKHAKTIKLLSNNGGEFDNKDVQEILCAEDIVQRLTALCTIPQYHSRTEWQQ